MRISEAVAVEHRFADVKVQNSADDEIGGTGTGFEGEMLQEFTFKSDRRKFYARWSDADGRYCVDLGEEEFGVIGRHFGRSEVHRCRGGVGDNADDELACGEDICEGVFERAIASIGRTECEAGWT